MPVNKDHFVASLQVVEFLCMFCLDVVEDPKIFGPCEDMACASCIRQFQHMSSTPNVCPKCKQDIKNTTKLPRPLTNIYDNLLVYCQNSGCTEIVRLGDARRHNDECPEKVKSCKYGCGQMLRNNELEVHKESCSSLRIMAQRFMCLYCQHLALRWQPGDKPLHCAVSTTIKFVLDGLPGPNDENPWE